VKGKLFKFLVSRNVAEQTVPATFVYLCISMQHIIQCVNTLHISYVEKILGSAVETYRREFLYIGLPYLFIVILLHVIMLLMSKTRSKIVGMLEFSIYMTIAFTYIVYPFGVYAFALTLAQLFDAAIDPNTLSLTGMSCFFVFGALFISLSLRFRNEIQSKSILSTVSCSTEIISYFLTIINQFIFVIRRQDSVAGVGSLVLGIVKLLIFFICIYSSSVNLFFWDLNLNIHYSKWQLRVVIICILSEIYEVDFTASAFMILIITQALTSKLVQTITSTAVKINFMAPSITPRKVLIGVVFMEKYTRVESSTKLSPIEVDLFFFYTGLWQSNYHKIKLEDRCVVRPKHQNDIGFNRSMQLELLISFLKTLDHSSPVILKLIMKLQVIQVLPYLKSIRQTYERLKKVNGDGLLGEFDTFHYRKLLESKLDALYKGKIKDDDPSLHRLHAIYESMSLYTEAENKDWQLSSSKVSYQAKTTGQSSGVVFTYREELFPSRILGAIRDFGQLSHNIENSILCREQIFSVCMRGGESLSSLLFECNLLAYKTRRKAMEYVRHIISRYSLEGMMSYYYPTLIFYFSLIRYDIKFSERLLFAYKKKLLSLSSSINRRNFTNLRMESDAAILQVDLDADSLGNVISKSLNYAEILGQTQDQIHVKDFLPGKFKETHHRLMDNLQSFSNLGMQRNFFMTDLNNNYRDVLGCVKIMPSIKESSSALVILSPIEHRFPLVLLDQHLLIISQDYRSKSFVQADDDLATSSISKISKGLECCIKLLKVMKKMRANKQYKFVQNEVCDKSSILINSSTLSTSLMQILTRMEESNSYSGLNYLVDSSSDLFPLVGDNPFPFRFEFEIRFNVQVVKVYFLQSFSDQKKLLKGLNKHADSALLQEKSKFFQAEKNRRTSTLHVDYDAAKNDIKSDDRASSKSSNDWDSEKSESVSSFYNGQASSNNTVITGQNSIALFEELAVSAIRLVEDFVCQKLCFRTASSMSSLLEYQDVFANEMAEIKEVIAILSKFSAEQRIAAMLAESRNASNMKDIFNKKNSGKSGQGQAKNKKTSALLELNKAPHTLVEMSPRVITRRDGLSSTNLSFLAEASATARVNTTMRTSRTDNQRKGSKIANIVADQGAVVVIRNIDDQKVTKSQHSIHNMQRPSTGKVGQKDQPITYLETDLRLVSTQSNEIEVKVASTSVVPKLLHKLLVNFFLI